MSEFHKISVIGDSGNNSYPCSSQENVLRAMHRAGLTVIPTGCRGGGCGICKVQIVSGQCEFGKMSRAHISAEEEQSGSAGLACKLFPTTDLQLRPVGKLLKNSS